ncbi:hypothetical protein FRC06_002007, partial [Ceratobasidium sp. 370]
MSTPEPPSTPPDALSPDRQRSCPCCGKRLGARQIQRHVRERGLAEFGAGADGDDSDLADDRVDLAEGDLAGDAADEENDNLEGLAQPDVDMDFGGVILEQQGMEGDLGEAGAPEPMQELRRNPPVRIQDWPEMDPNFDLGPGSEDEDEPFDGPDRDPEYAERNEVPAFDPIDEPRFTREELRQLLYQNLGDLADEQWIDM